MPFRVASGCLPPLRSRRDRGPRSRTSPAPAGTRLIDDFHAQKRTPACCRPRFAALLGYLNVSVTRAVPRNLKLPRVEVSIETRAKRRFGVDARGLPFEIRTRRGRIQLAALSGPVSVCAVGTSDQWGFGFKALPFARAVRAASTCDVRGRTVAALSRVPLLWTGKHPLDACSPLATHQLRCALLAEGAVPDRRRLIGHRDKIRYGLAAEKVDVLDFHELLSREASKQPSLLRLGRGVLEQAVAPALGFSRP